jgi:hypothetical protein
MAAVTKASVSTAAIGYRCAGDDCSCVAAQSVGCRRVDGAVVRDHTGQPKDVLRVVTCGKRKSSSSNPRG